VVVGDARFCKECGASLGASLRFKHNLNWNPWIAVALSIIPGLGQFYKGKRLIAAAWLIGVAAAYAAGPIGLVLHLICAVNAALGGALEFPRSPLSTAGRFNGLTDRQ